MIKDGFKNNVWTSKSLQEYAKKLNQIHSAIMQGLANIDILEQGNAIDPHSGGSYFYIIIRECETLSYPR